MHFALPQVHRSRVLVLAPLLIPLLIVHHVVDVVRSWSFPELPHVCVERPDDLVIPASVPVVHVHLDVAVVVTVAEGSDFYIELPPFWIQGVFDHLRPVDQDVFVALRRSRELKEGITFPKPVHLVEAFGRELENCLLLVGTHLLSCDEYLRASSVCKLF